MKISVIVPCYNEEKALPFFLEEVLAIANDMAEKKSVLFEALFIDDGSKDGTLKVLKKAAQEDNRIRYISFSRNFGKESAMYAGFKNVDGDYVAVMDADMQDPPSLLPEMYDALQMGMYDSVATRRISRKGEPPIRSFFARCFYKLINRISDSDIVDGARDFRLMKRQMVDAILSMGEYNRFSKGIFGWVGFRTKWLAYENVERVAGETKWSFWKLFKYSLLGIVAFSTVPLAIASFVGALLFVIAAIGLVIIVVKTLVWGDPVAGFPMLACLLLIIGGSVQLSLGIIGQYLAKTYMESKKRPLYIIAETSEGRYE